MTHTDELNGGGQSQAPFPHLFMLSEPSAPPLSSTAILASSFRLVEYPPLISFAAGMGE